MRLNKTKRGVALAAAVVTLGWGAAQAEAPVFSGYVDFGYNFNFNGLNANKYRAFDGPANTFLLQNAELVAQGKGPGDIGYRVDVAYGHDASVVSTFDGTTGSQPSTPADQVNLQQALITAPCSWTGGLFTFGKFVTPFGAEVIESKDNYNSSRGMLFTNAIPLVHTGIKYDKGFSDGRFTLTGGVVNGWDVTRDTNKSKSAFVQTGINILPRTSITLGGMYGPEQGSLAFSSPSSPSTEKFGRSLVDAIVKFTATDKLTLLANADWGVEEGAPYQATASDDTTANWAGVALYANYLFTDAFSGTVRYENFDDEGSRLTPGAPIHQIVNSYTFTLQHKMNDLIARVEYRTDMSTDNVFMKDDGTLDDTQNTLGFNIIYPF